MKKILSFCVLCLSFIQMGYSQPTTSVFLGRITSTTPRTPLLAVNSNPVDNVINIQYFDGVGKPIQTIGYKASPDALTDIVSASTTYHTSGLQLKSYVPFSNAGNGALATNPTSLYNDFSPFSEVGEYELSSMRRVLRTYGVGQAWRAAEKPTLMQYGAGGALIRKYTILANGTVDGTGNYGANGLTIKTTISEQGIKTIEYIDNEGQLIQKESEDDNGFLKTAYIYDNMNRLRYVIPPKYFDALTTFNETQVEFEEGLFAYRYDEFNRTIEKHVPSAGWTKYVYNRRHQLVLSQDAKQSVSNLWVFSKTDAFDRVIMSGTITNTGTRTSLQTTFNTHAVLYEVRQFANAITGYSNTSFPSSVPVVEADIRAINYYDDYKWRPSQMAYTGTGTPYYSATDELKGLPTGSKIKNLENNEWNLSVLYYDYKKRVIQTQMTHHLGGITAADRLNKIIITNNNYNFSGDVLSSTTTYKTTLGADIVSKEETTYDHLGRKKNTFFSINGVQKKLATYSYDAVGRMVQTKILPDAVYKVAIDNIIRNVTNLPANNTVDQANKTISLKPGTNIKASTVGTYNGKVIEGVDIAGLQTIDYAYHIRGWMQGINLDPAGNAKPNSSQGDLFSYKLEYETAGYWDGNIGKQTWQTVKANASEGERSYAFVYDKASRLKTANYASFKIEDFAIPMMTYDKNGNILSLKRKGKRATDYALIDDLNYTYAPNSNRLTSITDATGSTSNEVDFVPRGTGGYTYYADGSLKSDANEQIADIIYDDFLKQPKQLTLNDGRWIKYFYDGSGTLLKTQYSTAETWINLGALIYKNNAPYQMSTPLGRATYQAGNWQHEFNYTDHLGNTRVSFTTTGTLLEKTAETAFDPWGVRLNIGLVNAFQNRFEFLNRQKESTFGINYYRLGARGYNGTTGRFDAVDPVIDGQEQYSTYQYSWNNPVLRSDADGRCPEEPCENYGSEGLQKVSDGWLSDLRKGISQLPDKILSFTDLNDATVLGTMLTRGKNAINIDGTPASNADKSMAAIGAFVPLISGSAVKKLARMFSDKVDETIELFIDYNRHPESAKNLDEAIGMGKKNEGVIDRAGIKNRRKENMKGHTKEKGKDADEAMPALVNTGEKAKVKNISPSDNRGAGSSLGHQAKTLPNGQKVKIVTKNNPQL